MNADTNGMPLQFDTAIPQVAAPGAAAAALACAACGNAIGDQYFDAGGHSICESCRRQAAEQSETPRGAGVLARAGLFGLGAALAGAALYYAVIAITEFEIGLVAIAIGYMVGYAVRSGARGRGGVRFQVMAVVLTYWAVGLAYVPLVFQATAQEDPAVVAAAGTAAEPRPDALAAEGPGSADEVNIAFALAVLVGMSLALPVLMIVGSLPGGLISAAIIAFGMHQAYRMTAAINVEITGPYRVGEAPVSPA